MCYLNPEGPEGCVFGPCSQETPSNADRIRAMSDEALAAFQTPTRYALQHREVLL